MLHHLRVRNLGVIEDASLEPSPSFTVITGETGAGKTLLLGGLRLILGAKADAESVGPAAEEAQVDALLEHRGEEVGVTRIVPRSGRSRAYLNGGIVSADSIGSDVAPWVEVVGQHDQLTITRSAPLLAMVDSCLDDESLTAYRTAWRTYQDVLARQRRLGGDPLALARELDLTRYQAEEIERAGISAGIDVELEAAVAKLRNVEEITEHLSGALRIAEGMAEEAGEIVSRLRKVAGLDQSSSSLATTSEGLMSETQELVTSVRNSLETLEQDPDRLEDLESTLTAIGELKRKYGRTIEEVIDFGMTARSRTTELEELMAEAEDIDSSVERSLDAARRTARSLSETRSSVARQIERDVAGHLADLGLASGRVEIVSQQSDMTGTGTDRLELQFASDPRLSSGPVTKVASGGELSRLVLALRLATRDRSAATLVFDEVDTGIGGTTALAMGKKLADLARTAQVLCVTHLPQVAAHADRHYVVSRAKDGIARVGPVEGDGRVMEIARMLAGLPESQAGRSVAAELLADAGNG